MAQSKSKKTNVTDVQIIDRVYSHIVEHGDGEKWGRRDCSHSEHNIKGIKLSDDYPSISVPFKVIPNKPYYLLYALYQTGDSFGYDTGNIEFVGLYRNYDLATRNRDLIQEHYDNTKDNFTGDWESKFVLNLYHTKTKTYQIHVPWTGYFERLESVEIQAVFLS